MRKVLRRAHFEQADKTDAHICEPAMLAGGGCAKFLAATVSLRQWPIMRISFYLVRSENGAREDTFVHPATSYPVNDSLMEC